MLSRTFPRMASFIARTDGLLVENVTPTSLAITSRSAEDWRAVKENIIVVRYLVRMVNLAQQPSHKVLHLISVEDFQFHPVQIVDGRNKMKSVRNLIDKI